MTSEIYDWDLEPPSEESEWSGPLYDEELGELETAFTLSYDRDRNQYDHPDLEEIELWEERVDLAKRQMILALGKHNENPDLAQNAYDTGLMMIYDSLDNFQPEYVKHPIKDVETTTIESLRVAYLNAYDRIIRDSDKESSSLGNDIDERSDSLGNSVEDGNSIPDDDLL